MGVDDKKTQLGTGPLPRGQAAQSPDPLLGQILAGRYRIERKLGEGGMGAVYLAQHTVLEKSVALKILHGEFARKPDLVERFMQEAKAASRIRHENVIDISDFGITPDGLVFFAMELLSGYDLHDVIARARLARRRVPWERSRRIFLQVCAALSAAHAHGIVHRDLKPENIYLVEWLGHQDFVKLLDFGIAKMTEVPEGERKLTRTGMLFGTPEYMSPEQARGEPVDHRVDIYAMGCILYQLITGRVPFEAENFMGILSLHLTEPPPPIPPAVFDEIGAPLALEPIVMRALTKSRAERWQTIDELANAIRALHGEVAKPVLIPRPPRAEWHGDTPVSQDAPVAPPRRARWPWLIAGALVIGGGVAVAIAVTRPSGPTPAPAPVAIAVDAAPVTTPPPPAQVTIKLDSQPPGADVIDAASQAVLGKAPLSLAVTTSREPRRFSFRLEGHAETTVELQPVADIAYTAQLAPPAKRAAPAAPVTSGRPTRPARPPRPTPVPDDKPPEPPGDKPPEDEPAIKIKDPFAGQGP